MNMCSTEWLYCTLGRSEMAPRLTGADSSNQRRTKRTKQPIGSSSANLERRRFRILAGQSLTSSPHSSRYKNRIVVGVIIIIPIPPRYPSSPYNNNNNNNNSFQHFIIHSFPHHPSLRHIRYDRQRRRPVVTTTAIESIPHYLSPPSCILSHHLFLAIFSSPSRPSTYPI